MTMERELPTNGLNLSLTREQRADLATLMRVLKGQIRDGRQAVSTGEHRTLEYVLEMCSGAPRAD